MAIVDMSNFSQPFVSVILPTYNHLSFLPTAIESVVKQSYPSWELVIVNDGSTDGTTEYLNSLSDPRIRVIHQQNMRLPSALNTGFLAARGSLLTWISSDNVCAPCMLEALVNAMKANPQCGFVYSSHADIDENGAILKTVKDQPFRYANLIARNVCIASFMYRKECQDKVGLYDREVEGAEDWDMWIRISECYESVYIPDILYYYRRHGNSLNQRESKKVEISSKLVFQNTLRRNLSHFDLVKLYPTIIQCKNQQQAIADACLHLAHVFLKSPYPPVEEVANILRSGVEAVPQSLPLTVNLICLLLRLGQWEEAQQRVSELAKINNPGVTEFCRVCFEIIKLQNSQVAENLTLLEFDESTSELIALEKANVRQYPYTACLNSQQAQ